jgi:hypothetical protein
MLPPPFPHNPNSPPTHPTTTTTTTTTTTSTPPPPQLHHHHHHPPTAGITKDALDGEASTRKAVQKRLRSLLGPDAVLVGHSLQHDLRALRLDHWHVIDTSLLFRFKGARPGRALPAAGAAAAAGAASISRPSRLR